MMNERKSNPRDLSNLPREADVLAGVARAILDQNSVRGNTLRQSAPSEIVRFGRIPEYSQGRILLHDAAGEKQVGRITLLVQLDGVIGDADVVTAEDYDTVRLLEFMPDQHIIPDDLDERIERPPCELRAVDL